MTQDWGNRLGGEAMSRMDTRLERFARPSELADSHAQAVSLLLWYPDGVIVKLK
jgi:hypothetical protein